MDRNRGFDINALRQQLEDLFEDFFPAGGSRRPSGGRGDQAQHLPVNLVESEDAYVLTAPLPGFEPGDIEINVRGQNLNLRAQRKNLSGERPNFVRHEWGYGPFHRSVDLPGQVDAEHASAGFKHGVVTITIPKGERPQPIPVEETDAGEEAHAAERDETPETTEPTLAATETDAVAAEASEAAPGPDAGAETDDAEARGGRSFYMRPAQGGRRHGRGRRGERQAPVAHDTDEQAEEEASVEVPLELEAPVVEPDEAVETGEQADSGYETATENGETEPEDAEPEAESQVASGEESERPQEPGAEDASPVAHTTTASDTVQDLSDQRGPSTDTESETENAEPLVDEITDEQDADRSQTSNEPTD